jgi:hypothetical protein
MTVQLPPTAIRVVAKRRKKGRNKEDDGSSRKVMVGRKHGYTVSKISCIKYMVKM